MIRDLLQAENKKNGETSEDDSASISGSKRSDAGSETDVRVTSSASSKGVLSAKSESAKSRSSIPDPVVYEPPQRRKSGALNNVSEKDRAPSCTLSGTEGTIEVNSETNISGGEKDSKKWKTSGDVSRIPSKASNLEAEHAGEELQSSTKSTPKKRPASKCESFTEPNPENINETAETVNTESGSVVDYEITQSCVPENFESDAPDQPVKSQVDTQSERNKNSTKSECSSLNTEPESCMIQSQHDLRPESTSIANDKEQEETATMKVKTLVIDAISTSEVNTETVVTGAESTTEVDAAPATEVDAASTTAVDAEKVDAISTATMDAEIIAADAVSTTSMADETINSSSKNAMDAETVDAASTNGMDAEAVDAASTNGMDAESVDARSPATMNAETVAADAVSTTTMDTETAAADLVSTTTMDAETAATDVVSTPTMGDEIVDTASTIAMNAEVVDEISTVTTDAETVDTTSAAAMDSEAVIDTSNSCHTSPLPVADSRENSAQVQKVDSSRPNSSSSSIKRSDSSRSHAAESAEDSEKQEELPTAKESDQSAEEEPIKNEADQQADDGVSSAADCDEDKKEICSSLPTNEEDSVAMETSFAKELDHQEESIEPLDEQPKSTVEELNDNDKLITEDEENETVSAEANEEVEEDKEESLEKPEETAEGEVPSIPSDVESPESELQQDDALDDFKESSSTKQLKRPISPRKMSKSNLSPRKKNGTIMTLSPTKTPKTPDSRKLPPIKAPVGLAPNPNLKNIKSKIGSFDNIKYKPGGGDKKVITMKLEWRAAPKIGSLMDRRKERTTPPGDELQRSEEPSTTDQESTKESEDDEKDEVPSSS